MSWTYPFDGICRLFPDCVGFYPFAKSNGIMVGPGRGSAAGSIVAYSLEITDIDPIRYQLIFERFLNPERVPCLISTSISVSNGVRR